MSFDTIDSKLLNRLQQDARLSWSDLAETLSLSAPAVAERVRRLEAKGVIRAFTALIDPEAAGYPLTAFVAVTLGGAHERAAFLRRVRALPEIIECHHVTGEDDYLLKVRAQGTSGLDRLLTHDIRGDSATIRTRTTIVLATAKESMMVPIQTADDNEDQVSRRRRRRSHR